MNTDSQNPLRRKKLFVLDMDGTFYLGNRIIEGSLEFLEKLHETGADFIFFTNNSSNVRSFYIKKLAAMGCQIREDQIMTSGDVTIDYLKRVHPGKSVFLLGTEVLRRDFAQAGITLDEQDPDIVIAAFDKELTYRRVDDACRFIRGGAVFLATHPDLNCPIENGGFIPDCGAICAMLTASTGVSPKVLGKPYKETLDAVVSLTGARKEEIAFVGDRLITDIAIGVRSGVTSILVLSGEATRQDAEASEFKPEYIFPSLRSIAQAMDEEIPAC